MFSHGSTLGGNPIFVFKEGPEGFDYPTAVAVTPDGSIVVTDFFNNRIRKINTITGIVATIW